MRHSTLFTVLYFVGCVCLQPAAADPPAAQVASSEDAAKVSAPVTAEAGADSAKLPAAATLASVTPPSDAKAAPAAGAAAATPSTTITEAQIKKYRSKGYKPQVHDGKTVFCHSEANLGSRLEHQVCRTAEQLEEDSQQGQDMARDIQHGGTISVRSSP